VWLLGTKNNKGLKPLSPSRQNHGREGGSQPARDPDTQREKEEGRGRERERDEQRRGAMTTVVAPPQFAPRRPIDSPAATTATSRERERKRDREVEGGREPRPQWRWRRDAGKVPLVVRRPPRAV